ncbi:MAG: SH3 domain-containing protein [Candidatus Cloacimonadaceae bacterium]|jgi:hypothetical protein
MKYLISISILIISIVYGNINEHYFSVQNISLKVVNVAFDDALNLRESSSSQSRIVAKIPHNAITIKTTGKINGNWLQVKYISQQTQSENLGWVSKHYVEPITKYKTTNIEKMQFSYPSFLKIQKDNNGWINFKHEVSYMFEQYTDGKNGVVKQNKLVNLNLYLKIYDTFKEALAENYLQDYNFSKQKYEKYDPVQKIHNGFTVRTGVEGVGQVFRILQKSNKTIVFALNYNINPITPLQNSKPVILKEEDKIRIQEDIFKTMIDLDVMKVPIISKHTVETVE